MSDINKKLASLSPEQRRLFLRRLKQTAQERGDAGGETITATPRDADDYQVSYAQERFWFLDQLVPGNPADHIPGTLRLAGRLDVSALERALAEVVRRHESLRTGFVAVEGKPRQVIVDDLELPLPKIDLRSTPAAERDAEVARLSIEHHHEPFDLEKPPLVRMALVELADDEHALLVSMHHIVSDGWSLGVMVREIMALYQAFRAGESSPLPELELQYADFAHWQRDWLQGEVLEEQLSYWRGQLADLPLLELPTDRPRPTFQSYEGARITFEVPDGLRDSLAAVGRRAGVTPFVVLLAAFQVLIHRLTGQHDLVVGTPIANRNRAEIEGMIGFFVNMLVMRGRLSGETGFLQLLDQVKEVTLEAFGHQDLPFERLVEDLQPERDPSRPPLFQVMFGLQNLPIPEMNLTDLELSSFDVDYGTAQYDLNLSLFEGPAGMVGWFEYNRELFDETTIRRWAAMYQRLLEAVVETPETRLDTLPLLGAADHHLQRFEWNDSAHPVAGPSGLHRFIEQQAERTPDAMALRFEGEGLTYAELIDRSSRLARHLRSLGVGPETVVGVYMERRLELSVALLGILQAGAAYLPLDPDYPADRLASMLDQAGARVVLSCGEIVGEEDETKAAEDAAPEEKLASLLEGRTEIRLDQADELLAGHASGPLDDGLLAGEVPGERAIYVMFTSGSTGLPKGVVNTHGGLVNRLCWMQRAYPLGAGDKVLHKTAYGFDVSAWELFWPLMTGATLVMARPGGQKDSDYLAQVIADEGVTTMHFVPSMLRVFLETPGLGERCAGLKRVIVSGEALAGDLVERHGEILGVGGTELHNLYGPTEAAIDVTAWPCSRYQPGDLVPIGRPIDNLRIHIADSNLRAVGVGVAGELLIAGAGLARGYIGRPALTAERFVPDPSCVEGSGLAPGGRVYRTGDLASLRGTGEIEFLGRIDFQVKVRGFRIELGEIEEVLRDHPGVEEAVVVAQGERSGDRYLAAYIVPVASEGEAPEISHAELKAFAGTKLPEYMVPSGWMTLEALPRTTSGKIDRKALPAPDRRDVGALFEPPRNPVEELLARQWETLLRTQPIGIHDNFFELGGHSLLAIQLMNKVREALSVDLPLRELFKHPTIAELARLISQRRGKQTEEDQAAAVLPTIEPDLEHRNEPFPLTDIQEAYWIGRGWSFELGGVAAHNYSEIEGTGWDLVNFTAAIRRLVDRHDMLRVIFRDDGQQQILAEVPDYEVKVLDLREVDQETRERELLAVREVMSHEVLPADQWPLFELRAALLPDDRVRLFIGIDLLISDAWSTRILLNEFAQLYLDPERELPPRVLSFRDYVVGLVSMRDRPIYQRALSYWRERVRTIPPAPQLPMIKDFQELDKPHFVRRWGRLAPERWNVIKERAAKCGLTPSVTALAIFSEVLATWSKNQDFTLNLTLFNRLPFHHEVNSVVGDFTSLTMLEVDNSIPGTFEERARRIQERLWDDLDHNIVSGVQVIRELAKEKSETPRALMPVVFTSTLNMAQEADQNPDELQDDAYAVDLIHGISQTPQVTLDHQVSEQEGQFIYLWDAMEEPYAPGMWEQMFAAYQRLLEHLGSDEENWTRPVGVLLPDHQLERRAVLGAEEPPASELLMHQLFHHQVVERPEATAVVTDSRTLTYREIHRRSGVLARRLRDLGARPNQLVGVVMEKGWEQVVATLAILEAGAAYLPIAADLPADRIAYLLENGEAEVVLTQSWVDDELAWPAGTTRLVVDREPPADTDLELLEPVQGPGDLAYVIFTSGSTGQPKGVMIDHRGAVNTLIDINHRFAVGPDDCVLALSSLSFDLSVYDIFGMLAAGGSLAIPPADANRDPERWVSLMARAGVNLWDTVPALMEMLVEWLEHHRDRVPEGLRLVLMSGDWIPLELPNRIRALWPECQVTSLGGATEASIWSILYPIEAVDPAWRSIPYGKAMVRQSFHVLDPELKPRPEWVPGDLFIGGIGLAKGYWRDAEKTAASFVTHPETGETLYRTGDVGRFLPDGNIEFMGREDLQVKVQGHRIELGEIESVLLTHPAVESAVVAAFGERLGNKRLIGYVVPRDGHDMPAQDELAKHLGRKLPGYMIPVAIVELDKLPLTANGKVDRKALPEVEVAVEARQRTELSPEAEKVAMEIAERVTQVLGGEGIDRDLNLLELGASSIEIVRIANLLEDHFGFRPRMADMFMMSINDAAESFYEQGKQLGLAVAAPVEEAVSAPVGGSPFDQILANLPMLRDPGERDRFKERQPGIRTDLSAGLELAGPPVDDALAERYLARRSRRTFDPAPIPATDLGNLLAVLRQISIDGKPKYLYGSAGGLYPVQTYLYLKPDRVEGMDAGIYYYHPINHRLEPVSKEARLDASLYAWVNQPIFEQSAFAVFLVAELAAIAPMYGHQTHEFCLIEAGLIAQALEMAAEPNDLGLCQIGGVEFDRIRPHFQLGDTQQYVYGLLGGRIDRSDDAALAEAEVSDWEEGTL